MRIYLVRHAIAVPRDAPGVADDASRELTKQGITRMRRAVRGLSPLKIDLNQIWASPYLRALQTAEILAQAFPRCGSVRTLPALAPGGDFDSIVRALAEDPSLDNLALVGHEPDLGELAARLLGSQTPILQFKKGGMACIEIEELDAPYRGELCWLLTPRQLRAMA
jgi:phosphohistidine phosphatase